MVFWAKDKPVDENVGGLKDGIREEAKLEA
jgi:hypothetical protein